ncbi:MAG: hypothetical protein JNK66_07085 [Chitinophagales bacterium]|nr:hypothetical protein [Chitinophagales bacterium]
MWSNTCWTQFADVFKKKLICRLAVIAYPKLSPNFDDPDVQLYYEDVSEVQYSLVKIAGSVNGEGKLLLGYVHDDLDDFIPINKECNAIDYLNFFNEGNRNEAAWSKDRLHKEFNGPRPNNVIDDCSRASDYFLPVKTSSLNWSEHLFNKLLKSIYPATQQQVWRVELPFSNKYDLLELFVKNDTDNFQRHYYLLNKDSETLVDEYALDGQSAPIYHIWQAKSLVEIDATYIDYLRFFCWALYGGEGRFILPTAIRDIPWTSVPDETKWNVIYATIRSENPKAGTEGNLPWNDNDTYRAKAIVCYGEAIFNAWFGINEKDGAVRMVDDEPILGELPMRQDNFATLPLTSNVLPTQIETPHSNVNKSTREENTANLLEITADEFMRILNHSPDVPSNFLVKGEVYITDTTSVEVANVMQTEKVVKYCFFENIVVLHNRVNSLGIHFENCFFNQQFIAKDCHQTKSIQFIRCTFADSTKLKEPEITKKDRRINLENLKTDGSITFKECVVLGEVWAPNMKVGGNVSFEGCRIANSRIIGIDPTLGFDQNEMYYKSMLLQVQSSGDISKPVENGSQRIRVLEQELLVCDNYLHHKPILELSNSQIQGNLSIKQSEENNSITTIAGNVNINGADIKGITALYGLWMIGNLSMKNTLFHEDVQFAGDWLMNAVNFRVSLGYLSMDNSRILGSVYMNNCEFDEGVSLSSVHIESHLEVLATHVNGGDFILNFSHINGMFCAYPRNKFDDYTGRSNFKVNGDLSISGAHINGIRLEAATVLGAIESNTGKFGTISICAGDSISNNKISATTIGGLFFNSIYCEGKINFAGIQIINTSSDSLRKLLEDYQNASFSLVQSKVGGNLLFYSTDLHNFNLTLGNEPHIITKVEYGRISLEGNTIDGYIDLRGIDLDKAIDRNEKFDPTDVYAHGNISINNTGVKLGLDISGIYTTKKTGILSAFNQTEKTAITRISTAKCLCIYLSNLTTNGDVNLAGVRVKGNIIAPQMNVRGTVCLIADNITGLPVKDVAKDTPESKDSFVRAEIGGKVDLTATNAEHVNLDSNNFTGADRKEVRIFLERCLINKLTILTPTPKIDFKNIVVKDWDLNDTSNPRASDGQKYIAVLKSMYPFERSIYVETEIKLRNQSKDDDANMVYVAMRDRVNSEENSVFKRVVNFIYKWVINYGTNVWKAVIIWHLWVGLWIALYFQFSFSSQCVDKVNVCAQWGIVDGIKLALRYAIPSFWGMFNQNFVASNEFFAMVFTSVSYFLLSIIGVHLAAKFLRKH